MPTAGAEVRSPALATLKDDFSRDSSRGLRLSFVAECRRFHRLTENLFQLDSKRFGLLLRRESVGPFAYANSLDSIR